MKNNKEITKKQHSVIHIPHWVGLAHLKHPSSHFVFESDFFSAISSELKCWLSQLLKVVLAMRGIRSRKKIVTQKITLSDVLLALQLMNDPLDTLKLAKLNVYQEDLLVLKKQLSLNQQGSSHSKKKPLMSEEYITDSE